jgi:hypothetical protein
MAIASCSTRRPPGGKALGLAPPFLTDWKLIFAFQKPWQRFIKWDARLGNTIVGDDGAVDWISWKECGQSDPLRDLVKILCEDWLPDWPAAEERLIETHFSPLLHGLDTERGRTFLAVYTTLISGVRPGWVVPLKGAAHGGTRRCAPNTDSSRCRRKRPAGTASAAPGGPGDQPSPRAWCHGWKRWLGRLRR